MRAGLSYVEGSGVRPDLTGLADHGDRVEALFANGASAEVDVLVGADGIRSLVRRTLFGPENPRFTEVISANFS